MNARRSLLAAVSVLAACASDVPRAVQQRTFDASAGEVHVTVGDDGFVQVGDRRLPLEAIVLELRQRTRAMSRDDVQHRFVVHLRTEPLPEGSAAARRARRAIETLLLQSHIMGIGQVKVL